MHAKILALSITRGSHYVPQATLRRWSDDGNNVWAYRLLVSHEKVPLWELRSIKGLVCQDDLYTLFEGDAENDDFERFITGIEEPGQEAIEKLLARSKMKPHDWHRIAKFVAAQQLRTPLAFREHSQKTGRYVQEELESLVRKYEAAGRIVPDDDGPSAPNYLKQILKVSIEPPEDGSDKATVRAEIKSARSDWMAAIRHHLAHNIHLVVNRVWRAAAPHGQAEWPLCDHPVLTLNYYQRGQYDFHAGWGKEGSEFILPISPKVALYTKVGDRTTGPFSFSREQTEELREIMVRRAFRWIIARQPLQWVAATRPREVNPERFDQERQFWREWNSAQSQAEAEFQPNPSA